MENYSSARTQLLDHQARALSGRDLQLWSLGFLIMLVLVGGVLAFAVPGMQASTRLQLRYLPQLSIGLIALITLLNVYLFAQRRELERLRHQVVRELALGEGYEKFAVLDPLTQVFRRAQLPDLLNRELARSNREGAPLTLLLVRHESMQDLEHRMGRAEAENFVADVARLLQQNFRGSDAIVRYSTCEFLVLMSATTEHQAKPACARLQDYVDRWNLLSDSKAEMSLVTVTTEYAPGTDPTTLVEALARGSEHDIPLIGATACAGSAH